MGKNSKSLLLTCVIDDGRNAAFAAVFTTEEVEKIWNMVQEIMSWHPEIQITYSMEVESA